MESIEIRRLDIEVAESDPNDLENGEGLIVQGYIAVNAPSHILGKENKKKWREVIEPGTFGNAIAKSKRLKQEIDFLADHDNKKILASTLNNSLFLEEDDVGLYINARISETTWGKDLFVLVRDGIIKGLSFGMKVIRENWTMSADGLPLRTISEIDLFEISALKIPAYPTTLLESRGLEVTEVEIPDDLEKRNLQGGNGIINDNQEITPLMMYNGMTLIAEKLDAIVTKMDTMDSNKTIKGLEDAKLVLAEVKAVAELTAGKAVGEETVQTQEEIPNGTETVTDEEKVETDETKPLEGNPDDADVETKSTEEEKDETLTDETKPVEGETKPAEGEVKTEEKTEVKTEATTEQKETTPEKTEAELEEERKKKALNEVRSWLGENKKVEVPENE